MPRPRIVSDCFGEAQDEPAAKRCRSEEQQQRLQHRQQQAEEDAALDAPEQWHAAGEQHQHEASRAVTCEGGEGDFAAGQQRTRGQEDAECEDAAVHDLKRRRVAAEERTQDVDAEADRRPERRRIVGKQTVDSGVVVDQALTGAGGREMSSGSAAGAGDPEGSTRDVQEAAPCTGFDRWAGR